MLNSPMLSIFQHFQAIPLCSPLISLRSKWRLTGFSHRFTPKNPVRLHKPSGQLPLWGAKNDLPLNLIALPSGEGCDTRIPSSKKRRRSRHLNPKPNESKVKRGCEEMRIHFFTAPSVFISSYDSHTDHRRQHFHRSDSVSPDDGLHSRRR